MTRRALPPLESNDLLVIIGDQQVSIRRYMKLTAELSDEADALRQQIQDQVRAAQGAPPEAPDA